MLRIFFISFITIGSAVTGQVGPVRADDGGTLFRADIDGQQAGALRSAAQHEVDESNDLSSTLEQGLDEATDDLPGLVPATCSPLEKLAGRGKTCTTDYKGCAEKEKSLQGGRYACPVGTGLSAKLGETTERLACQSDVCVAERSCQRTRTYDCRCKNVCEGEGAARSCKRVCDTCSARYTETICAERHEFACEGAFTCERDVWRQSGGGCRVTNIVRQGC